MAQPPFDCGEKPRPRAWAERFFELSADLLLVLDAAGHILQASPSWEPVLGWKPEALETQRYESFVHPADLAVVELQLHALRETKGHASFTCHWRRQDGSSARLSWSVSASRADGTLYCSARPLELPPQVPAASAPQDSSESLKALALALAQPWHLRDELPLGLYMVDARSGKVLYANPQFFKLWHIEPLEELCRRGEGLHAQVIQHCMPTVKDSEDFLQRYSTPGEAQPHDAREDEVPLANGRTLLRFSTIIGDARGTELCWLHVFMDITERKRTEEALRSSELTFRKLIESAPESICVHRDKRFVFVNPAMLAQLRYEKPSELIGRPVSDIVHPDDRELLSQRVQTIVTTGKSVALQEMRYVRSDGSSYYGETVAMAIEFDGAPSVLVLGRDITERKQIQAKLAQADRMVMMGTLAAGVGHEINNPLTYVLSNLALAGAEVEQLVRELRQAAPGLLKDKGWGTRLDELQGMLQEAHTGAERVRTIVRDLKIFSRQGEEERAPVDVRDVLDFSIKMSLHELRSRARVVKQYEPVPVVFADSARLGQVFLNLLVNAAQAIPEGRAQESEITVRVRRDVSGRVAVEVTDTGIGIPAEVLPCIFDPFFTTKPVGSGTGLGLSICHGIIKGLGGEITVHSEVGRGSTFTVLLPVSPSAARPLMGKQVPLQNPGSHILIIDDEPGVGRALSRMLGGHHQVTVALSGQEGLDRLKSDGPFGAIFCDLMMPDLSGMDLYERMLEQGPGLATRFIFMTGGAFTPRAREFLETVPNGWLEKPFDAEQIHRLLGRVLREHRGQPVIMLPREA